MYDLPKYQQGGLVGPGGMPVTPPVPTGQAGVGAQPPQMGAPEIEAEIQRIASQNPQVIEQVRMQLMQAIQSGAMTAQQLNTMVQMATVAAQNPQMYPQLRRLAIQQGLATEQDLPVEYNPGLVFVLMLAGQAVQDMIQPEQQAGAMPSMAMGGAVPKSKRPDGGVAIEAHEGEYVIPKNVVDMKGREFFDNLVTKYSEQK